MRSGYVRIGDITFALHFRRLLGYPRATLTSYNEDNTRYDVIAGVVRSTNSVVNKITISSNTLPRTRPKVSSAWRNLARVLELHFGVRRSSADRSAPVAPIPAHGPIYSLFTSVHDSADSLIRCMSNLPSLGDDGMRWSPPRLFSVLRSD